MSIKVSRILYEEIVNSGKKPVFIDSNFTLSAVLPENTVIRKAAMEKQDADKI